MGIASLSDLKATQMNMQYSLIWELMLYEFELNYNAVEATKSICCVKGEDAVDTVQYLDSSRNFAQVARTSTIRQNQSC